MPESSIRCPLCGRRVLLSDPRAPFCSDRCALLDLGNWASERYRIAASLPEEPEPASPDADPDAHQE